LSAVVIAQLVAHEAGKSVLCHEGGDALFQMTVGRTCFDYLDFLDFLTEFRGFSSMIYLF